MTISIASMTSSEYSNKNTFNTSTLSLKQPCSTFLVFAGGNQKRHHLASGLLLRKTTCSSAPLPLLGDLCVQTCYPPPWAQPCRTADLHLRHKSNKYKSQPVRASLVGLEALSNIWEGCHWAAGQDPPEDRPKATAAPAAQAAERAMEPCLFPSARP